MKFSTKRDGVSLGRAIERVGKAMGTAKFDDAMGGAMLPSGDLSAAGAISVIFGISYEEARARLRPVEAAQYKKACEKHAEYVRRSEIKWQKTQRKKI